MCEKWTDEDFQDSNDESMRTPGPPIIFDDNMIHLFERSLEESAGITEELRQLHDAIASLVGNSRSGNTPPTILLVDDNEDVLDIVRGVLSREGFHVYDTPNPLEAMDLVRRKGDDIDICILDIMMPEMDGRQLAEEIESLYPNSTFLFMSGAVNDASVRDWLAYRNANFISKPFVPSTLARKVKELIRHTTAVQPTAPRRTASA